LAVFDILESENLISLSQAIGQTFRARFEAFQEKYAIVGDVRGLGVKVAMELVTDREGKQPAVDAAKALTGRAALKKAFWLRLRAPTAMWSGYSARW
jgi:4-aminobutyrate aminotransferase-like enzyme